MICIQRLHDYDSCCLAVTPLQSGIFSNRLFSCINVVSPYRSENFLPLSQQTSPLGMYILDQVYSTTWLGQALPPFTTKEYTLAPFDFRSFQSCLPHSDVPDGNRLGACSEVCYCGPCAAANSSKAEFHVRTALRGGACCALPRFEYFDFLLLTTAQAVLNSSTYQHRKSDIAYFAGSHVIDDVRDAGGDLRELYELGYRYGYGKYIGQDGWGHVGIE
jgi:hypothetical protein